MRMLAAGATIFLVGLALGWNLAQLLWPGTVVLR